MSSALNLVRCPNCRARLSANTSCPRCGTDLSLPWQIAQQVSDLQRVAVGHILSAQWSLANSALVRAQRLHRSEFSKALLAFVDDQSSQSMHVSSKQENNAVSAEPAVEGNSLSTVDLAEIERYG